MKSIVCLLIASMLAVGSGCAKTDWIDRTLVTEDVTGTWDGSVGGGPYPAAFRFELEQQGSAVKGFLRLEVAQPGSRDDFQVGGLLRAQWLAMSSASERQEAVWKANS